MSVWARRRQLSIIFIFVVIFALIVAVAIYFHEVPETCSDGLLNQDEIEVDCGGVCLSVCLSETRDLTIIWSRVFKVRDGVYDIAAQIENTNNFGIQELPYTFEVYDSDNLLVKEVQGTTYINPGEQSILFSPAVDVGSRIPSRAVLRLPDSPNWLRLRSQLKPIIGVTNKRIDLAPFPIATATIENKSLEDLGSIDIPILIYDNLNNIIAVSRTVVGSLSPGSKAGISFSWPAILPFEPVSFDILPRTNLVKGNILKLD